MSYHFFTEQAIIDATSAENFLHDINLDLIPDYSSTEFYGLAPVENLTAGENFVYNSELTNTYLSKGSISFSDQWEAETQSALNGWKSDLAFEGDLGLGDQTQAGGYIKNAILHEEYLDKGYIDYSDVFEADSQAFLQGPLEEYNFSYNSGIELTPGGEFIKNAHLTDSYLADGTFDYFDVVDIEMTAQIEAPLIEYLF